MPEEVPYVSEAIAEYERRALKARRETIATALMGTVMTTYSLQSRGTQALLAVSAADVLIAELDK